MQTSANERDQAQDESPFLSTEQVVELLGLSGPTVRKLVSTGDLPAHRVPGGRKLLFLRSELLAAVSTWANAGPPPEESGCNPIDRWGEPEAKRADPHTVEPEGDLVLTIDDDGEERWESLDRLGLDLADAADPS